MEKYLVFSKEVQEGMQKGLPIVALESTIISHGMPYPQNVAMAREVEQIVRDNGGVPATIAIVDGKIKIGLSDEELEMFGSSKGIAKVSRRDLADVVASKRLGATTVASTMICAALAGIKFFVTGGLGGVHRGWETTLDISADMDELAQTSVTVICAGAKSILDLPATLEYLETKGVPVVGYGVKNLPAFFTRDSGLPLALSHDKLENIADMIRTKWALGLEGGVVVANPIREEDAMDPEYINGIIASAVKEAEEKGIVGKDITPFLLGKIVELTDGKSLEANIKLVKNNAKIGTQLAVHYFNH
ncbi:pseudouridine-5-phosphate glycosidase [Granulicatella sp. zg-ZJ]|uniref:pseudouridine-5'-phosphate glycosidase n=1 Tax=unclassified Granulicatella TaxID=2630493 RepID=UPI0013C2285B|nr:MULTISPECIES: pseudouridine-5'-phosphate glycosidase [unclassified Granulicatella]MBS4750451.1 pseudouridine-5'-phosphate glycosidase [Carnobacteriaceae bacterium zg-ZUI78]NEW63354.1 pseudouridine-5-phosphate glycosidase [Granulicatella sp. zg-ZJ]NEW65452.1 pseudouridine-5-phosphate glycosidase [Granulicatella sp. zg-84]QMI85248.1 pseudouridine-5'-phosphate glycosidase [Carnobacteriaceae bacterium zg-84]